MAKNRNYKRAGGNGPITRSRERFILQKGLCYYCDSEMYIHTEVPESHPRRATREHLHLKSKGGTGKDNVVLACHRCNTLRRDTPLGTFQKFLSTYWLSEDHYQRGVKDENADQVNLYKKLTPEQREVWWSFSRPEETSCLQSQENQVVREDARQKDQAY